MLKKIKDTGRKTAAAEQTNTERKRPGRKPALDPTSVVSVRFTASELLILDSRVARASKAEKAAVTRAEIIRRDVLAAQVGMRKPRTPKPADQPAVA